MGDVVFNGATSGAITLTPTAVAGTNTLTLPAATDTLVGKATTDTLTNKTLTSPTITGANMSSMASSVITSDTSKASTSGTSVDFSGIPSWAKRITVIFQGVSTNGTSNILIQLGTSGGIVSSGYISTATLQTGATTLDSTAGFLATVSQAAGNLVSGLYILCLLGSNVWCGSGVLKGGTTAMRTSAGDGSIGGTVTQLRVTTVGGTDTFDAGSINIFYE